MSEGKNTQNPVKTVEKTEAEKYASHFTTVEENGRTYFVHKKTKFKTTLINKMLNHCRKQAAKEA